MFRRSERVPLKPQRPGTITEMNGVKFDPPVTIWAAMLLSKHAKL